MSSNAFAQIERETNEAEAQRELAAMTTERDESRRAHQNDLDKLRHQEAYAQQLREALQDMNAGWKYIRQMHGDLYGVGWDRAQDKADAALAIHADELEAGK